MNISADRCTSEIFLEPSVTAIKQWRYDPALDANGNAVQRSNIENFMSFFLNDERGQIIRNYEGFPQYIDRDGKIIMSKQKEKNNFLCEFLTS